MRYANILRELCFAPWALDARQYRVIWKLMEAQLARHGAPEPIDNGLFLQRREFSMTGGIAEIHVLGTLAKGLTSIEKTCGNTSYEQIHADIDRAEAENADAMLFNFDSLGGHLMGLFEVAQRIREHPIPSVAYTEGHMCSAAYLLGAACAGIVTTQSAEVGSIGVILMFDAPAEESAHGGVIPVVITNKEATLKGIGAMPLTEEQREHLEERAQSKFDAFKGFVTQSRAIPADAMRGQSIEGGKAVFLDMVDGIGDYGTALELAHEFGELAQLGG